MESKKYKGDGHTYLFTEMREKRQKNDVLNKLCENEMSKKYIKYKKEKLKIKHNLVSNTSHISRSTQKKGNIWN